MTFDENMKIFEPPMVRSIGEASPGNSMSISCCKRVKDKVDELILEITSKSGEETAKDIFSYPELTRSLERIIQYCNNELKEFDNIDVNIHYASICNILHAATEVIGKQYKELIQ